MEGSERERESILEYRLHQDEMKEPQRTIVEAGNWRRVECVYLWKERNIASTTFTFPVEVMKQNSRGRRESDSEVYNKAEFKKSRHYFVMLKDAHITSMTHLGGRGDSVPNACYVFHFY